MATTYTLISSSVLTGSQASVTFSAIPQTYTDLCLKISSRGEYSPVYNWYYCTFNGLASSNGSSRAIEGNGSSVSSFTQSNIYASAGVGNGATANTFDNTEIYIPNYTSSSYKPINSNSAGENNGTAAYITPVASLWSNSSPITSIEINISATNFVAGSSFYLYGIKNS